MKNRTKQITRHFFVLGSVFLLATSALALDREFRCGLNTVIVGDGIGQVIRKCGEPMVKNLFPTGGAQVWQYNGGQGSFIYTLTFHGATLQSIKRTEERGSGRADWEKPR